MTARIKACNSAMAQAFGGEEVTKRYYDCIHPPKEEETSEEVISRFKTELGKIGRSE